MSAKGLKDEQNAGTNLQIRARMSPLPVANRPPVGLGATDITINKPVSLAPACLPHNTQMKFHSLDGIQHGSRTRIFVTLKHELCVTSPRIPELNTAVL